jgi:methylated-DNA-[protein]-cysteine S-methyltransferase
MSLDKATVATTVTMDSPIGELELVARAGAICEIRLVGRAGPGGPAHDPAPARPGDPPGERSSVDGVLAEARRQLVEYFAGRRRSFELPLAAAGTPFQLSVWRALAGIGYGQTTTYAELARSIGRPHAARAVRRLAQPAAPRRALPPGDRRGG